MKKSSALSKSHPRYTSLLLRERIAQGVKRGLTSLTGLTAHGRGETFDYLLGEKTYNFAREAIKTSAALLVISDFPVVSVNGNTAALTAKELVTLSKILDCPLEINLFHFSKKRAQTIMRHLKKMGANTILLPDKTEIKGVSSGRKMINMLGQMKADVILVPLEDGDRTEALKKMGKKIITIDLNPLSRTSKTADITIVDNITRALPLLISDIQKMKKMKKAHLHKIISSYNNDLILKEAEEKIRKGK